mmetsp:Transcript_59645/g.136806  ORF Transcript_59645/g.136806 Transcript_59645/m.136806 type:complete len:201 (+) Transcript_59645:1424-2026(+)
MLRIGGVQLKLLVQDELAAVLGRLVPVESGAIEALEPEPHAAAHVRLVGAHHERLAHFVAQPRQHVVAREPHLLLVGRLHSESLVGEVQAEREQGRRASEGEGLEGGLLPVSRPRPLPVGCRAAARGRGVARPRRPVQRGSVVRVEEVLYVAKACRRGDVEGSGWLARLSATAAARALRSRAEDAPLREGGASAKDDEGE